jgi:hypothetical protein
VIAEILGFELIPQPDGALPTMQQHERKRVRRLLTVWLESGALEAYDGEDRNRNKRRCVRVGNWQFRTPEQEPDEDDDDSN